MNNVTRKTKTALKKYTPEVCARAWVYNRVDGEGAYTAGLYTGLKFNQANAAISAWDEVMAELPLLKAKLLGA